MLTFISTEMIIWIMSWHIFIQLFIRVVGISLMITSMKSTHESLPFKHSVVRLYKQQVYAEYSIGGVNIGK